MTLHAAPVPLTSLLSSQRGGVGETWWGRRFLEVVMKSNDYIRLNAGKSYARNGQVQWIEASPCSVEAKVSGSYVYAVRIRFTPLSDDAWKKMLSIISDEASFAARLMAGSVPEAMERRLAKQGLSLFPRVEPKSKGCNCPDKGSPCKHEAAIYFLLAENIDKDPFLLFLLHGKTKEEVLSGLREARVTSPGSSDSKEVSVLPPVPSDSYYRMGAALPEVGTIPGQIPGDHEMKKALYDQLGKCPVPLGDANLGAVIAELYPRAAWVAARWTKEMNRSPETDSP
ncbi:hypothetical protein [uncultured Methanospirillum sp.]|uniref:SWIM zinc finger family protein n=1 Tax=uncultured Methanospirillum sp. TaxID=262503 RepID=UPI0029C88247|nr:hypothetical protein [uncultured Methanospirillum sp.]